MKAILKARYRGWCIRVRDEVERPPLPPAQARAPLRPHYVTRVDGAKEDLKPYSRISRASSKNKLGGKKWDEDEIEALREYTEMLRVANSGITPREVAEMALEREIVCYHALFAVLELIRP